ncbi:MAG: hypothetical protein SVT52_02225, partial [Planctomycetota bacterium]|nr:hypothetical protein [Planctomycetota bacterium]
MSVRPWIAQCLWFAVACGLLVAAGLLQGPMQQQRQQQEFTSPGDVVAQNHPEVALLTTAPGGLRALLVNYLWIRAEQLKNQGRFFDAMQLAELICKFQPRFAGVWSFHSWNMAWNISVATHTPAERWMWVSNGIRLLRDNGIPLNPRSLILYKDLGWIFFSKMGQTTDEMHKVYKQRWAAEMQRLLGAPPAGTTAQVIEAFRPIAAAPLDKDPRRQGLKPIQPGQLAVLLRDPGVAAYAELLAGYDVRVDESLLDAYNRYSLDDGAAMVRVGPPVLKTERQ